MDYKLPDIDDIAEALHCRYPHFGINKQQELVRLVYEISLREKYDFKLLLANVPCDKKIYRDVKNHFLKQRFPNLTAGERRQSSLTTQIKQPAPMATAINEERRFLPKKILVEKRVARSPLLQRAQHLFPEALCQTIPSLKEYMKEKTFSLTDYNNRGETLVIAEYKNQFCQRCPCSPGAIPCGYDVLNLGQGCIYDCEYCFLQGYINSPGIIVPANLDDVFTHFKPIKTRLGSGEFADSLALDHLTEFSPQLVEFFRKHPQCVFEFKTKSTNIDLLLSVRPAENIVVGWSLNPPRIIQAVEHGTAPLHERIAAARTCLNFGYRLAFHFDPIVFYPGWEEDYLEVVRNVFAQINPDRIAWISLGTLRMTPKLRQSIEARFPGTQLLESEFTTGFDGKLRYSFKLRQKIYHRLSGFIREFAPGVNLYLCMEEHKMVQSLASLKISAKF